jgi:hypothetical protein
MTRSAARAAQASRGQGYKLGGCVPGTDFHGFGLRPAGLLNRDGHAVVNGILVALSAAYDPSARVRRWWRIQRVVLGAHNPAVYVCQSYPYAC